ncbi:MAG: nickel pincer cofactor biosynthesis protein LarB [Nitrospinota bacterium]|nr:nickel pincer cofactor biosynthesis protein LarB [Nitrospinota bacterium]
MNEDSLKKLLDRVKTGKTSPARALEKLKKLPYEDLGFARIDHHRTLRKGFSEVIYCEGKSLSQITSIAAKILDSADTLLATRGNKEIYKKIKKINSRAKYNELARAIVVPPKKKKQKKGKVLVLSAGTSDIPVAEEAVVTADTLGSKVEKIYDVGVAGIHRVLDKKETLFAANVIVVVAGMDGALASVVGGLVERPVVAVPTSIGYGASFQGVAALLTMLNSCATGVAVVNIDNGFGAGYFAHKINILSS